MWSDEKQMNKLSTVKKKGRLVILSSPSGGGKSTVCRLIKEKFPELEYSISTTTRPLRPGDEEGRDYIFIEENKFKEMIENNDFVEWAVVHGNYYGTSRNVIEDYLKQGKDCILDIDVQGGMHIKEKYPDSVSIFIMPPSIEELEKRLKGRSTDSEESIQTRLKNAKEEIEYRDQYDHIIVNDKIEETINKIVEIINNK